MVTANLFSLNERTYANTNNNRILAVFNIIPQLTSTNRMLYYQRNVTDIKFRYIFVDKGQLKLAIISNINFA
jgi:hypothetical protein